MGNAGSAESSKTRCRKERKERDNGVDDRPGRTNNKKVVNGPESQVNGRESIKYRTTNPFIIFFLRLRSKKPKEHVTVIARAAGKLWTRMTPEQRKKYIDLAKAEKKRREGRRRKRRPR
ncbi:high mobility group protein homolog TDP-1-like [Osmia bicornis bicornis]|uniref:high mobility group protein homolog TDP-1-like n=1 Tax=Osmia bicornis bicornis TaxID=1437191 RepID=UPI0010F6D950|nr:high mobility group protein homolog TDP-1-like [Osmia bicornis bicornis]